MFKNKGVHARSQVEKFTRYSIRKVSFGVASVAVATGLFFLGGGSVQANSPVVPARPEVGAEGGVQGDSESLSLSKVNDNTLASESSTDSEMEPAVSVPRVPATVESQPETAIEASEVTKVDTSKLEAAITRMETALGKAGVSEKTAATIENAKEELAKAQTFLSNEKATQEEVDKATRELKNKAFVIESMPKAEKKKANNNQDSRNGQAIPGNGESGFREAAGTTSGTNYREKITTLNAELTAEIEKVKVEITKEESLGEGKKNKEKLDILRTIVNKAEGVKQNATNATTNSSASEQTLQAEWTKIKQEKDKLGYYLNRSENWGAPINNNKAGYGNNPTNGVFENLKDGFGKMVDFTGTSVESKSKTIEDQVNNLQSSTHYGKVTYHWKTKKITATDAENGMLNGWKIGGTKDYIHAVRPEEPTDYTLGTERAEKPKSAKVYDNNGKIPP